MKSKLYRITFHTTLPQTPEEKALKRTFELIGMEDISVLVDRYLIAPADVEIPGIVAKKIAEVQPGYCGWGGWDVLEAAHPEKLKEVVHPSRLLRWEQIRPALVDIVPYYLDPDGPTTIVQERGRLLRHFTPTCVEEANHFAWRDDFLEALAARVGDCYARISFTDPAEQDRAKAAVARTADQHTDELGNALVNIGLWDRKEEGDHA